MKRILIVEDVEFNLDLLIQLLEDQYEIVSALNGEDGLELAESAKPDLILMDLSLPKMDGWETTRRIRANGAIPKIPIIAVTSHAMRGDEEKARAAGCSDYLTKPVDHELLLAKVARHLCEAGQGANAAKILIVDDEPFNVDLLEQELELLGYQTFSAYDGQECLDKVKAHEPDLILLDVMMPILDGFTVCKLLKSEPATQLTPIIIMTALDAIEDRIKGIQSGADDFLTKPVDERELKARIETAIRLKQAIENKVSEAGKVGRHYEKFVSGMVKRRVAENPDQPELQKRNEDISVLFLDIVGYTKLSEMMSASALNALVEYYFSAYLDRLHEFGGDISQTSGDGLMVLFQDTDPTRHAALALEAATAVFEETQRLNTKSDKPPIALRIGINSGEASVGSTRYEGKRGSRWVFTADGFVVNLAARLASVAGVQEICLSESSAERVSHLYDLEDLGLKELKNVAAPTRVFKVLGPTAALT